MENMTDATFELIKSLETKKRWLKIIIIGCLTLAPIGLSADVYSFMVLAHEKGGLSDQQIVPIVFVFITLILILSFGINKYIKLKKWDKNIQQLELLEETIYKEVLQTKTIVCV
jgi:sulfite exporter TauE/SafE